MIHLIRPMLLEDAFGVASVNIASWQTAYRGIIDDEILDNLDLSERTEQWKKNTQYDDYGLENIVCISKNNEVIGFATYGEERVPEGTGRGELWAIYVHPNELGKGIGRAMWNYFEDHRKRYEKGSVVWVLSENAPAIRFYESLGFKKDGETKNFVHSGKSFPELRMIRQSDK